MRFDPATRELDRDAPDITSAPASERVPLTRQKQENVITNHAGTAGSARGWKRSCGPDPRTQVSVDLSLVMLALVAQVLDAVSRQPEPHLLAQGATLMRQAHQIGVDLASDQPVPVPNLEQIRQAMDGGVLTSQTA